MEHYRSWTVKLIELAMDTMDFAGVRFASVKLQIEIKS